MAKWIQLDSGFYRHPKTLRLKRLLGSDALWIPARLWCYCSEHESDDVSNLTPQDLADVLECAADPDALRDALMSAGFISADGKTVVGWAERYGAKLRFYRDRAKLGAAARWSVRPSGNNTDRQDETRLDKTRKQREASLKDASSMLQASAGAEIVPRFVVPSPEEVEAYSKEIGYPIDGAAWCDSYAQKGWLVGKGKMKDWRAAVRNWKRNGWTPGGSMQSQNKRPEAGVRRVNLSEVVNEGAA